VPCDNQGVRRFNRLAVFAGLLFLSACSRANRGVQAHLDDQYPEKLSEWNLFIGAQRELKPNAGVLPYEVKTALFSNGAAKFRTVWLPSGATAAYSADGVFRLPVGSVLSKTFSYDDRRIETRIYIHRKNGWQGVVYVWNRQQTDAILDVTPAPVKVEWKGQAINYEIPNVNQCKVCHEGANDNGPLGITAKQLNRDGQLEQWFRAGYLTGVPTTTPPPASDTESRARDYLDVNCGTCHAVGGRGMKSGVYLTAAETDRSRLGVCLPPANPPGAFNIVPGKPEKSTLIQRMTSLDPKIMMPDLGHSVIDRAGVELIEQWIREMKGNCPT